MTIIVEAPSPEDCFTYESTEVPILYHGIRNGDAFFRVVDVIHYLEQQSGLLVETRVVVKVAHFPPQGVDL